MNWTIATLHIPFATFLVLSLCGCASKGITTVSGHTTDDIVATVVSGEARLTCSLSCSGAWGAARHTNKALYEQGLWRDLAAQVARVGHKSDQSYFYFGRAAEGLGQIEEAKTYYRLALASDFRCAGIINNCDGLVFPKDITDRLVKLQLRPVNGDSMPTAPAPAVVEVSVQSPELVAMETFVLVQFQQDVGTVLMREYALSSTAEEAAIAGQVEAASALVSEHALVHERFGLDDLSIAQERIFRNNGVVTGEYVFGGRLRNKRNFLRTLFSKLLQTDVDITIDDGEIHLQFAKASFRVLQQNGKGVYQRDDEVRVVWPADSERLELLIAPVGLEPDDVRSLEPWLTADVSGPALLNVGGTNDRLQHDFDIARLNDLMTLGGYIEAYQQATGRYPLQGDSPLPHYSFIATAEQQRYVSHPSIEHTTTGIGSLLAELQRVLGDELQLPFDPQRVPVNMPNFYVYMIDGDNWYLTVHLHEAFPFANRLADYNHKLELTNSEQRGPGQWLRSELLVHEGFRDASGRTPHQPSYVQSLREDLGGNEAF